MVATSERAGLLIVSVGWWTHLLGCKMQRNTQVLPREHDDSQPPGYSKQSGRRALILISMLSFTVFWDHPWSHGAQVTAALVAAAKSESEEEFRRRKRAREHELREAEDTGVQVRTTR